MEKKTNHHSKYSVPDTTVDIILEYPLLLEHSPSFLQFFAVVLHAWIHIGLDQFLKNLETVKELSTSNYKELSFCQEESKPGRS